MARQYKHIAFLELKVRQEKSQKNIILQKLFLLKIEKRKKSSIGICLSAEFKQDNDYFVVRYLYTI